MVFLPLCCRTCAPMRSWPRPALLPIRVRGPCQSSYFESHDDVPGYQSSVLSEIQANAAECRQCQIRNDRVVDTDDTEVGWHIEVHSASGVDHGKRG